MRQQIATLEKPRPASLILALSRGARTFESVCAWVMSATGLPIAFLIIALAAECMALTARARATTFWNDELLTFHVSHLLPFARFWKALEAGVDGMPPGYYFIVRALNLIPGDALIVLRLPSIFGYFLTLMGVYWFTRRRLPAIACMSAVLLVAISPFRSYAFEARSYALLTGLLAISAVFWQRVEQGEGKKKLKELESCTGLETRNWILNSSLLGSSLFLAVSCHHLAVFALSAFAFTETIWTYTNRRVRRPVWLAFAFGAVPFFLDLPLILHLKLVTGQHFWAKSSWDGTYKTYSHYLGLDWQLSTTFVVSLGIFVVACFMNALSKRNGWAGLKDSQSFNDGEFGVPEIALLGGFVAYPALLLIITKVLHSGGYTPRYGLPAVFGMSIGAVYLVRPIWSRSYSVFLFIALTLVFALQECSDVLRPQKTGQTGQISPTSVDPRWEKLLEISRQHPGLPVVIACGTTYLEAAQYAPPELQPRLVDVADDQLATRIVGSDTVDTTNQILAEFIPLNVRTLGDFKESTSKFLLYSGGDFDWLTRYLVSDGYRLNLVDSDRAATYYIAERSR